MKDFIIVTHLHSRKKIAICVDTILRIHEVVSGSNIILNDDTVIEAVDVLEEIIEKLK